ncbi:PAS domain-containing protein [Methylotuvimicrobium sp. KM2]|uniref:PAS domain-containing protein n=1 Tax=Methylotuvimicrobium sp. KM2 TaxID=3133976 RepID=UPI0031010432
MNPLIPDIATSADMHYQTRNALASRRIEDKPQRSQLISENIPVGLYIYHQEDVSDDRTLRMIYANPIVKTLTGLSPEDVVGKTLDENFPGLRAKGIPQRYAEVVRSQIANSFEDITYGDDRVPLASFAVRAFPLPDNHVGVVFENITERKRIETAATRSLVLLEATQRLVHVGGWEWDNERQTMTWTDETYRIHDMQTNELVAGSPKHIARSLACYDPSDRPIIEAAFRRCAEEGIAYDLEFPLTRIDQRRIWIRTIAEAIKEDGRVVKVIGTIADITERKQAEEDLKCKNDELTRFNKAAADREMRMIELKHKINELSRRLGEPPPYALAFLGQDGSEKLSVSTDPLQTNNRDENKA